MAESWRRLVFRVDGDADLLTVALWEAGTLGLELLGDGSVVAYFPNGAGYASIDWSVHGACLEADEPRQAEDWMAAYRAASRPLPIGERLVIDPREPELSAREAKRWPGRRLLRLPARNAFGTGSHASTRLALELLDELNPDGKRVLDVGFGTGILSFAALELGAASVVGVELDLESALVAAQNRRLNGIWPHWAAGTVAALCSRGIFDIAVVNVLPERIEGDLERIRAVLAPDAEAIFSGIATERERQVSARLERAGYRVRQRRALDEWSALVVR